MAHSSKLGGSAAYDHYIEECLFVVDTVAKSFMSWESSLKSFSPTDTNNTLEQGSKSDMKLDNILDVVFDNQQIISISERSALQHENKGYKVSATTKINCPLSFWCYSSMYYGMMSIVARYVLSPCATSTESERVFRISGYL